MHKALTAGKQVAAPRGSVGKQRPAPFIWNRTLSLHPSVLWTVARHAPGLTEDTGVEGARPVGAEGRGGAGRAQGPSPALGQVLTLTDSTGPTLNMAKRSVPLQMLGYSAPGWSRPSSLAMYLAKASIRVGLPPTHTNCSQRTEPHQSGTVYRLHSRGPSKGGPPTNTSIT